MTPARVAMRQRDHPRALTQQWQEMGGQREMAKVVRPELKLEAISGDLATAQNHHASVVDENPWPASDGPTRIVFSPRPMAGLRKPTGRLISI